MLQKIAIPPGVNRDLTQYALESGGWYTTDKVRFRAGLPEKIGGWTKYISDQLLGIPRTMHVWRTLNGVIVIAIGTEKKVYIVRNNTLIDITPIRRTVTITDPIKTTNEESEILITDPGHTALAGDYVTLSGASTFNGVDESAINTEMVITSVVNGVSYYVDCGALANAGGTGGGDVTIEYQVGVGLLEDEYGYGWGSCGWGDMKWDGTGSCDDIMLQGRIWSLDNWGEDLVMCPWGGSVYTWDATRPDERATLISQAPTQVQFVAITDDRHLACFGCNYSAAAAQYAPSTVDPAQLDTMRIEWCSQEDYTDWDIGDRLNTAGDYQLTGGSQIISAAKIDSIMMVWTDEAAHLMQAVDPPITFRFDQIGTSTGIISYNAWAVHNGVLMWLGDNSFYQYQGGVSAVVCPLEEYMFDNVDYTYRNKIFAALDRRNDEISWFYPITAIENTYLTQDASSDDTSLYVASTAGFPSSGWVTVNSKIITYTSKTDTVFSGCTIADDHSAGDVVSSIEAVTSEPCRYITFALKEQIWWMGRLERTAWVDRGMLKYPLATRTDSYIFNHDYGVNSDGDALPSYLESCDFDIDEGMRLMFINRFVPDFELTGSLEVELRTRYFPQSSQVEEVIGTVLPTTEYIDTRIRGREASLVLKSNDTDDNWRLGACRIDIQPDGGKR